MLLKKKLNDFLCWDNAAKSIDEWILASLSLKISPAYIVLQESTNIPVKDS